MRIILPEARARLHAHYCDPVRLSDFWWRMERNFGVSYARSMAVDYRVPALGATVQEALERGDAPMSVWRAVCQEFDVAASLR
jgi:hypothetical protein